MKHAKENPVARRLVTAVTAIAAVIALTAGGTLAYFSASETAHNVITSGGVNIELLEWADEAGTKEFADVEGVMPGEKVTKVVEVENSGANSAWVRIKVVKSFESEGGASELDDSVIEIDFDRENWTEGEGGWWYCNAELEPGETTAPLFKHVEFSGSDMGDAYQGGTAFVTVQAQAVQAANNPITDAELGVASVKGWPADGVLSGN